MGGASGGARKGGLGRAGKRAAAGCGRPAGGESPPATGVVEADSGGEGGVLAWKKPNEEEAQYYFCRFLSERRPPISTCVGDRHFAFPNRKP